MGKHRRPGPPNRPSRGVPRIDPSAPLAAYEKRRRPPHEGSRVHRPLHGGAGHLRPGEPRVLLEWDGFTYQPVGTADSLAAARAWVSERDTSEED
jgi:hypothetical protein